MLKSPPVRRNRHPYLTLFAIFAGILTVVIFVPCLVLWILNQPRLLDWLDPYPGSVLLKEAKMDENSAVRIDFRCHGEGYFDVKELRAYTTDAPPQQVLDSYKQESWSRGLHPTTLDYFYVHNKSRTQFSTNLPTFPITCLNSNGRYKGHYLEGSGVMVLDPKLEDAAKVLALYLPDYKGETPVLFLMRGLNFYD